MYIATDSSILTVHRIYLYLYLPLSLSLTAVHRDFTRIYRYTVCWHHQTRAACVPLRLTALTNWYHQKNSLPRANRRVRTRSLISHSITAHDYTCWPAGATPKFARLEDAGPCMHAQTCRTCPDSTGPVTTNPWHTSPHGRQCPILLTHSKHYRDMFIRT